MRKERQQAVPLLLLLSVASLLTYLYLYGYNQVAVIPTRSSGGLAVVTETPEKKHDYSFSLPKNVTQRIGKFLLFFGSGKSGHSIVGSLLDAHEHVIIPHEYHLFRKWDSLKRKTKKEWQSNIYRQLYKKSRKDSVGIRQDSAKGYSLGVSGLWQGRYDSYISVIGDKSGGSTRQEYMKDKDLFGRRFKELIGLLKIPICFIHVVRNPFDHVASRVLYAHMANISAVSAFKKKLQGHKLSQTSLVLDMTTEMVRSYKAEEEMIELFNVENILEIRIEELIERPREVLVRILNFLDLAVTDRYLEVCVKKVYSKSSHARDYISWPSSAKELLESAIQEHKFLSGYSFGSD